MKLFYADAETTGLNPDVNELTQVAFIIEIDGKVVEEVDLRMRPLKPELADPQALKVTGMTLEKLATFPDPTAQYKKLIAILGKYVSKYDKGDKFVWVGQNAPFDIGFIRAWFKANNNNYFGSYFFPGAIDTLGLAALAMSLGRANFPSFKLGALCDTYGVKLDAHDALNDIRATREVMTHLVNAIQAPGKFPVPNDDVLISLASLVQHTQEHLITEGAKPYDLQAAKTHACNSGVGDWLKSFPAIYLPRKESVKL